LPQSISPPAVPPPGSARRPRAGPRSGGRAGHRPGCGPRQRLPCRGSTSPRPPRRRRRRASSPPLPG